MITGSSLPRTSLATSERVFIFFWWLYTVIIITAFTSKLASFLVQERYYPDLDTIDELQEADVTVHAYKNQLRELTVVFNGTSKMEWIKKAERLPAVYKPFGNEPINYTALIYDYIPENPSMVNYERAQYIIKMKGLGRLLHIVKESPLPNYDAFQVTEGSPYLDIFNSYLRKVIETGLFHIWKQDFEYKLILKGITHPDKYFFTREKVRKLSLLHFQAAFICLFLGVGGSTVAFITEILYFKRRRDIQT